MNDDGSIELFKPCHDKAIVYHVLKPEKQWMENRIGLVGPCRIGNTPIFINDDNGQTHVVYGKECFWNPFNEDRMELTEKEKEYWTQEKIENIEAGKQMDRFCEAMKSAKNLEEMKEAIKILKD